MCDQIETDWLTEYNSQMDWSTDWHVLTNQLVYFIAKLHLTLINSLTDWSADWWTEMWIDGWTD